VEYGGLGGRIAGSAIGIATGTAMATPESRICLVVSPAPHGRVACGVVGAAGGAVAGEKLVGDIGQSIGDFLFYKFYGWTASETNQDAASD